MFLYKNNQKGSSLIEILGVITIIALIGIAALKLVSNTYGLFKQSMATYEIKDLQNIITSNYAFSGVYDFDYNNDNVNDINKMLCEIDKIAPNHMCLKSGDEYILRHRLNGYITIERTSDIRSYSIEFDNINKRGCISLSQIDWLDRKKVNIYQIDINNTPVAYFPKRSNKGFPVTSDVSINNCNKDTNTIKWYFY